MSENNGPKRIYLIDPDPDGQHDNSIAYVRADLLEAAEKSVAEMRGALTIALDAMWYATEGSSPNNPMRTAIATVESALSQKGEQA